MFHSSANDSACCVAISCKWRWWLWEAHVDEVVANRDGLLSIHKETTNFGFRCGSHDVANDFSKDKDESVKHLTLFVAEEMITSHVGS